MHKKTNQNSRRNFLIGGALLILTFFSSISYAAGPAPGRNYFTQYNLWASKGKVNTTNYSRGDFIPINSVARLLSISGKKMILQINGQNITIVNAQKYTKRPMAQIANEMLSPRKAPVGGRFANNIRHGTLRIGMSKQEVIMTRGYPPRHKTPSTNSDSWVYWSSRFVQRRLVFQGGRLTRGRGLH